MKFRRNYSLEYHRLTCNGKTKRTSWRGFLGFEQLPTLSSSSGWLAHFFLFWLVSSKSRLKKLSWKPSQSLPNLHNAHFNYWWFSRYVIAAILVDENKRFLISSFCSSTSNCTLQHCHLCPLRLVANHLFTSIFRDSLLNILISHKQLSSLYTFFYSNKIAFSNKTSSLSH